MQSPGTARSRNSLSADTDRSVRDRVIELGHAYWKSKLIDGPIPSRQDIVPLDVTREPKNFRFHLIGTNIVYHLAQDWTGSWFDEIPHMAGPSRIFNSCIDVATSGKALRSQTPYVGPHAKFVTAEDIILPLASDGETVDKLLVFVEHFAR